MLKTITAAAKAAGAICVISVVLSLCFTLGDIGLHWTTRGQIVNQFELVFVRSCTVCIVTVDVLLIIGSVTFYLLRRFIRRQFITWLAQQAPIQARVWSNTLQLDIPIQPQTANEVSGVLESIGNPPTQEYATILDEP